jgi:signal peptidase I
MKEERLSSKQRSKQREGGKVIPALCNLLGTLILLAVIALCLPMTLPRLMGYEVYHVVSGSMEPEIPVGSVIYVEPVDAAQIEAGEIIAFQSGDSVITHRVVKNQVVEGSFVTKGDANDQEDVNSVPYAYLIGRVAYHLPVLGELMGVLSSTVGKLYVICFAACGAMLNILAGMLRNRQRERLRLILEQELHESHGGIKQ